MTAVAEGLLNEEKKRDENGAVLPVRTRPLEEYADAVKRVRRLVESTGCALSMALDVAAGRLTESYVRDYVRQRRRLVQEEMRLQDPAPFSPRTGFGGAPRRSGGDDRRGG